MHVYAYENRWTIKFGIRGGPSRWNGGPFLMIHLQRKVTYNKTYPQRGWVVAIVHGLATETILAPPAAHQTLLFCSFEN